VFEALLRASPGALTAEQPLVKAWDENAEPFTRTVHVTVSRLKRKLGNPPLIRTTPGIRDRIASEVDSR
jgi:DNA-binding response OmpR family regulator